MQRASAPNDDAIHVKTPNRRRLRSPRLVGALACLSLGRRDDGSILRRRSCAAPGGRLVPRPGLELAALQVFPQRRLEPAITLRSAAVHRIPRDPWSPNGYSLRKPGSMRFIIIPNWARLRGAGTEFGQSAVRRHVVSIDELPAPFCQCPRRFAS